MSRFRAGVRSRVAVSQAGLAIISQVATTSGPVLTIPHTSQRLESERYASPTSPKAKDCASTILNEKNWNRDWVERQLAHVPGDQIRGIYNRAQYIDGRRVMLTSWSEMLCEKG